jgi:hypothetical protein
MRNLTPDEVKAITAPTVRPFYAIEMDYPDGPVRASTLDRPMQITSPNTGQLETFAGVGVLGAISDIEEGSENRSYGFSVTLSGIPAELAAYLRTQDVHGRPVWLMMGLISPKYEILFYRVIAKAFMDSQGVVAGEQLGIVVDCESAAVDWERARVRRYTDADHRARYPTDGFLKYIAAMEQATLSWGRA